VPISVVDLPLASVCALEPAQGDRGPFRGKLRAEYGAQVFTVDLPSGDITRHRASFADDRPEPERA
jgi:crotonobetainyl-CoA:carnitine CoA-transferase CaiB-like acyl-CoA transferase